MQIGDILYGINVANLTSADADVAESAIRVGTGWDNIFTSANASLTQAGALTVTSCTGCGGGGASWNGITNPTADQNLTFDAGEETTWTIGATTATNFAMNANALTSGTILSLTSNGTGALTGQKALNISLAGANGTGSQTTYGAYITNTHTGSGNNVGLYASVAGKTNNFAGVLKTDECSSELPQKQHRTQSST